MQPFEFKIKHGISYKDINSLAKPVRSIYGPPEMDYTPVRKKLEQLEKRRPGITADYNLCEHYERAYYATRDRYKPKPFTIKWPVRAKSKAADYPVCDGLPCGSDAVKFAHLIAEIRKNGSIERITEHADRVIVDYKIGSTSGTFSLPQSINTQKLLE